MALLTSKSLSSDIFKQYFQSNNRILTYPAHTAKVHSVNWNCDGRKLASGSFDKTVCLFSLEKDRLVSVKTKLKINIVISIQYVF